MAVEKVVVVGVKVETPASGRVRRMSPVFIWPVASMCWAVITDTGTGESWLGRAIREAVTMTSSRAVGSPALAGVSATWAMTGKAEASAPPTMVVASSRRRNR
ncbi:hypothetical protein D3C86_1670110 [compost metagenome]